MFCASPEKTNKQTQKNKREKELVCYLNPGVGRVEGKFARWILENDSTIHILGVEQKSIVGKQRRISGRRRRSVNRRGTCVRYDWQLHEFSVDFIFSLVGVGRRV